MSDQPLRRASIPARDKHAHEAWLKRGRTGEGRFEIAERRIVRPHIAAWTLTASRWVGCEVHQVFGVSVRLMEAEIEHCVWFKPNLLMARLDGAILRDTIFHDARMATCKARGIRIQGGALRGAQVQKADWSEAVLREVDVREAQMAGIKLQHGIVEDCDLRDADLSNAALSGTRFVRCDLRGATLPEDIDCDDCTR